MSTTSPPLAETSRAVRHQRHDVHDRPFIVIWEVTRACQLACLHCRADAIRRRNPLELDTAEGRALLEGIAGFPKPHPIVVLTVATRSSAQTSPTSCGTAPGSGSRWRSRRRSPRT